MIEQQLDWIGLSVDGYSIEELVGQGAFSWVYRGIDLSSDEARAFKLAKPADRIGDVGSSCLFPTVAVGCVTDGLIDADLDPRELLILQTEKLAAIRDPALPRIEEIVHEEAGTYCRMEFIAGSTLRRRLQKGRIPIRLFVQLARCMERLQQDPRFDYHGDLKPENIMVTASGIKLLDPGYFGRLVTKNEHALRCAVTTPCYYPTLEPDDLFAFGLILWEAATGQQPLQNPGSSQRMDLTHAGSDLLELVRSQEAIGRYHLSSILEISRPSILHPDMPLQLELFLLTALGLSFDPDQTLETKVGFESFGMIADALEELTDSGIKEFTYGKGVEQ